MNPKAWIMAIGAVGAFLATDQPPLIAASAMTGVFLIVNIPCISIWVVAGTAIGRLLTNENRRRIVNGFLGLLLVATVVVMNL